MSDARRRTRGLLVVLAMLASGCAVHYYDADSGVEHLFGFGHMMLKRPAEQQDVKAVVTGVESAGVSIGRLCDTTYFGLGVQRREQMFIGDENTAFWLDRPLRGGLFTAVVGSGVPEALEESDPRTSVCSNKQNEREPRTSVRAEHKVSSHSTNKTSISAIEDPPVE